MGNQEWTIHKHLHHWCTHYTGRRQTYKKKNKENKDKNQKSKNN
jgi:hypothetical protein